MAELTHTDLLVVGGGMAGLSAAAWSVRQGRSVTLVEKGAMGGTAIHAGFIWTAPTYEVLREQIPDGDPALARALVDGLDPAIEWVRSLGVECLPAVTVLRFGKGHQTDMTNYLRLCEAIVRDDPSSTVLVPAVTESLLVEDGAVVGAVIRAADGEVHEVRTEATLLATGGFQADPDLRAQYIDPIARTIPLRSNHYSVGDGLRLGLGAGARFRRDDGGFYGHLFPGGVDVSENDDYLGITLYYSEHALLLNLDNERFVDESVGDHLTTLALLKQPEARALMISDARVREDWILQPYVEGVHPRDTFDIAFQRGARAAIAESIDELAYLPSEWGYDGEKVREALLDFNRRCVEGSFDDPPRVYDTTPIDRPPFYVIEAVPAISFTFDGLAIDAEAHVLGEDGEPIPGLFAAGADAGGVFTRAYAGGLAMALVFALRASRTAIEQSARAARA
jgi:succinate dehydrogenase/fumarate reductase flavoprotein subunit